MGQLIIILDFDVGIEIKVILHAVRHTDFVTDQPPHVVPSVVTRVVYHAFLSRAEYVLVACEVLAVVEHVHHYTGCEKNRLADVPVEERLFEVSKRVQHCGRACAMPDVNHFLYLRHKLDLQDESRQVILAHLGIGPVPAELDVVRRDSVWYMLTVV